MPRRNWTRHELIAAFNLYCKLRFGQCHARNPQIIDLAGVIARTPDAVAMKLCNFASFDPAHKRRGVKGFGNASRADKDIWDEFNSDWNRLAVESERAFQELLGEKTGELTDDFSGDWAAVLGAVDERVDSAKPKPTPPKAPIGPTETQRLVDVRLGQSFFRSTILASFGGVCCICGLKCRPLLIASHIVPWAARPELRLDPRNGLCLCAMHDKAFDRGLIGVDDDSRIVISGLLGEHAANGVIVAMFTDFRNKPIQLPEKFMPAAEHFEYHRANVFRDK